MHTLERAGRPFSIVATANSMEGLYAPVIEDDAVTVSMGGALLAGLRVLDEDDGLPPLPDCGVRVQRLHLLLVAHGRQHLVRPFQRIGELRQPLDESRSTLEELLELLVAQLPR